MNLCGATQILMDSSGLGKNPLARGASSILGTLAATKNMTGVFDLAKTSAINNLNVLSVAPKNVSSILGMSNVTKDVRNKDLGMFSDQITHSVEAFDSNWMKSDLDNSISLKRVESYSSSIDMAFDAKIKSKAISSDFLDSGNASDDDFYGVAYKFSDSGNNSFTDSSDSLNPDW
jgi:hypothetical protein